jgi:hypothetical protein
MPDRTPNVKLRDGAVEWRQVETEVIALDLRRSLYLSLNRTGAVLWPLIVGGTTHDRLVEALREEFAVDESVARTDVDVFLRELRAHDLLESDSSDATA